MASACALATVVATPAVASASFGLAPDPLAPDRPALTIDARDDNGAVDTRASGHPFDAISDFTLNTHADASGDQVPDGNLRDIDVDLPPGLVGNPEAAAKCTTSQLRSLNSITGTACPIDSQVGVVDLRLTSGGPPVVYHLPVYNMVPARNEIAAFGFVVVRVPVRLTAEVRSESDYGLRVRVSNLNETIAAMKTSLRFWGVPGDPRHDAERGLLEYGDEGTPLYVSAPGGLPFGAERRPFLSLPADCTHGPFTTNVRIRAWEPGSDWLPYQSTTATGVTGCERTSFEPTITVEPDSLRAGSSTGMRVELVVPQNENPDGFATPPLKKAVVTLPRGMRVSPSAAVGLGGCSDAEIGIGTAGAPNCPGSSRIGEVTVTTPVLPDPLKGEVYLGTPLPSELLRLFVVVRGPAGLIVKLPGVVRPDESTGQLTAIFDQNPQLPFSKLNLHFKGGSSAPLSNPAVCGSYDVASQLSSWSGIAATPSSTFGIAQSSDGGACRDLGFAPEFEAGVTNPVSGENTAFTLRTQRGDADEEIGSIETQLPPGVLARVADPGTLCSASAAAAGSCPASSRIGGVTTGAGSGPDPLYLKGDVYLTEPYRGAPFGLSIVVPAVAGPFDLGLVVVRATVSVDPIDGHVTVISDPLPTILRGIPLQVRLVNVAVDRPGFVVNPTSCAAHRVDAKIGSTAGRNVNVFSPFRATECSALDLKPELALSLSGKGQTVDNKHPAVTAVVTQKPGQSNLKKVRVALPLSVALDPDNANGLCEFGDGSKVEPTCPKASIVGTATAVTPILDQPLSGPVYFVKNIRKDPKSGREIRTLPKLVVPLVGQNGLRLTLTGTSDVDHDQLVTTFDNIPDAPVSSFKMNIIGGKGGILVVSGADICKSTQIADQQIDGQNGKTADADVYIQTPSCPLKIISKKAGKSSVAVKVGGLGAGKVTVTGAGIRKTTKTITKSTVATVTAKRTKGKPGKVTVSFDPTGPAKVRKTSK